MQDYRQLRVHAKAHALAIGVRAATRTFPRIGYASLRAQMTSAAESIAFNIVEGCGANSQREFARFVDIGIRSTTELESQLLLARDYGVLLYRTWEELSGETTDARRMLFGLRAKILASISSDPAVTQQRTTQKRSTHNATEDQLVDTISEPPHQPPEE